jgi:hypothetical protein
MQLRKLDIVFRRRFAAPGLPSYGSLSPALQVLRRHISGKQLALSAVFA